MHYGAPLISIYSKISQCFRYEIITHPYNLTPMRIVAFNVRAQSGLNNGIGL